MGLCNVLKIIYWLERRIAWMRSWQCYFGVYLEFAWWRHQMETFSALLALCAGNSPVIGEFPAQRPVTWIFDVFFDLSLNKRLSKQSRPGDLRRHRAHYDVGVIHSLISQTILSAPKCQSNDNLVTLIPCLTRSGNEFTIFCEIHYGTRHL